MPKSIFEYTDTELASMDADELATLYTTPQPITTVSLDELLNL